MGIAAKMISNDIFYVPTLAKLLASSGLHFAALSVRPEGLEPPTFWSEARHSIRLSYRRLNIVTTILRS